jgi:hypothetical protein
LEELVKILRNYPSRDYFHIEVIAGAVPTAWMPS